MTITIGLELLLQISVPCLFINSALFLRAITSKSGNRKKLLGTSIAIAIFYLLLLFVFVLSVDSFSSTAIGKVLVKDIKMRVTVGIGWILLCSLICFMINIVQIYHVNDMQNKNKIFDFKCVFFNLLGVFLLFFVVIKGDEFYVYNRTYEERFEVGDFGEKKVVVMIEERRPRNMFTCKWDLGGKSTVVETIVEQTPVSMEYLDGSMDDFN